jgi:putative oxidoreductase
MGKRQAFTNLGLVVLRLGLGIIFVAHGGQKMLGIWGGNGWRATLEGFQEGLGIPQWLGAVAIITEFFGGIAVIIGALTRLASLGLAVTMVVAMVKVHWAGGFFLPEGIEFNVALLAMSLALVLTGGGAWAADSWIFQGGRKVKKE